MRAAKPGEFVVVFRATAALMDEEYSRVARALRTLALDEFGCLEFASVCEGGREIALSYWADEAAILRWKEQADHLMAQQLGRDRWYESYSVEITQVVRAYAKPASRVQ